MADILQRHRSAAGRQIGRSQFLVGEVVRPAQDPSPARVAT